MRTVITICSVIGTIYTVLKAYQMLYFVGLFKKIEYKKTKNKHSYGILVAARNEAKVIKNLLESFEKQDYDKDKIAVFVIAHNCTDNTAEIVREFSKTSTTKTFIYEYNNPEERTKGYALRYLLEQIRNDFGSIKAFDGYFVFDADNVLREDYITRMNEAFDSGKDAVVSFRNSKNVAQNWISFSYAMHWMRTCLFDSRGKDLLHLSCRVQGTGFLFANHFVEQGWNYVNLTDDRAFCTDVVVQGYRVGYCEDAKFYDEQPNKLKIALRQRVRWAKGHLQSLSEFGPKLLTNIFKFNKNSIRSYDTFWLNFPTAIESGLRRIISWTCRIILAILAFNFWGGVWGIVKIIIVGLAEFWLERVAQAIVVCIYYRNEIENMNIFKLCYYIFMFPLFDKIGKWSMYIALFKHIEWKPIPHDYVVDVDKFNKK